MCIKYIKKKRENTNIICPAVNGVLFRWAYDTTRHAPSIATPQEK